MCQAEFAYNRIPSYATKHSPFQCVYGENPLLPLNLIHANFHDRKQKDAVEQAESLMKLHKVIKENINRANKGYKQKDDKKTKGREPLKVGDLVWVHLTKERFPQLRKNKLMPRAAGPFPITAKFGDNAYQVALPLEHNVTNPFNIGDLQLYKEDQELRLILPQEGGVEPCSPCSGVEPCSPCSEHGPSTKDAQADPTDYDQRHSMKHIEHLSYKHEENNEKSSQDPANTASAQKEQYGPEDHSAYSSSHTTDQQPICNLATLHLCLRPDPTSPEMSKPKNVIFVHGPLSHQGPRTLLVITIEP